MTTPKKRPNKTAKAAKRRLTESKLYSNVKGSERNAGDEFGSSAVTPATNTKAIKPRPDKKRG